MGTERNGLVDCAEALRTLSPDAPLDYMYELMKQGNDYLEWLKANKPDNTSLISVLQNRIWRAAQFSIDKENAEKRVSLSR